MKKIIINENQRGFMFKNGRYVKTLGAGKHLLWGNCEVEINNLNMQVSCSKCSLETLLQDAELAKSVTVVDVGDNELALHYVNGRFTAPLRHGKYAFWSITDLHEFKMVDISNPKVDDGIEKHIFEKIPATFYTKIEVEDYEKARLYFDHKLVEVLDAGTYYFWKTPVRVEAKLMDMRLKQMNITGQEMLSADKVTLRINFVCKYRVSDCVRIASEIEDFGEQLHVSAQLALREYIGKRKLDEILENKEEMSEYVFEKLKEKEKELFIEIYETGIKDIILPGEIREIMNTVLVAEKRAQANVITRREEVASTRSLLNTAKLMEENQTLYKLKELEYIERICENVGSIHLSGNSDVLTQLTSILRGDRA